MKNIDEYFNANTGSSFFTKWLLIITGNMLFLEKATLFLPIFSKKTFIYTTGIHFYHLSIAIINNCMTFLASYFFKLYVRLLHLVTCRI